jgi:hypothetical protein
MTLYCWSHLSVGVETLPYDKVVLATYTVASCCFGSVLTGDIMAKYQVIDLSPTCYSKVQSNSVCMFSLSLSIST